MKTFDDVGALRAELKTWPAVAFVPTMGALHNGHLSLVDVAKEHGDVIVSIFVNPTQFGPNEDLDTYPRPLESDLEKCRARGVKAVFLPSVETMYGTDPKTTVSVSDLGENLCGGSRPGHFDGVTTVVSKLWNIVQPDVSVFGQKDYQQLAILRRLAVDLNFPGDVIGAPTKREKDGLAMSSRNLRLTESFRAAAPSLSRGLAQAWGAFQDGERDVATLEGLVAGWATAAGLTIDYVQVVDADSLERQTGDAVDNSVIAVAAFAGDVRLIDNIVLSAKLPRELK